MVRKNQKYMQKYYFNIILRCSLLITVVLLQSSCKDVFEEKLDGKIVTTILPTGNDTLYSNQVDFKWEEMEGADAYRLQIVSASFSDLQIFHLDSSIQGASFQVILNPGHYEYRIRGENSAYESDYSKPLAIYIDSVNDLTSQLVQLQSPIDGMYTNQMAINSFSWQGIFSATYYSFQIRNGSDFNSGTVIHEEPNIYGLNYFFNQSTGLFLDEGNYSWGIKALNQTSSSDYVSRKMYIDTTTPNSPNLIFPANNYPSTSNTISLKWDKGGVDPGVVNSPLTTTIEVSYNDSLFGSSNTTIVSNNMIDSLNYVFTNSGNYWWRAYLEDAAGNSSLYYSLERKIIIP